MKAGEGAKELPAFEGEDATQYIHRLAVRLGYIILESKPLKTMPEPSEPFAPREPGEDG